MPWTKVILGMNYGRLWLVTLVSSHHAAALAELNVLRSWSKSLTPSLCRQGFSCARNFLGNRAFVLKESTTTAPFVGHPHP